MNNIVKNPKKLLLIASSLLISLQTNHVNCMEDTPSDYQEHIIVNNSNEFVNKDKKNIKENQNDLINFTNNKNEIIDKDFNSNIKTNKKLVKDNKKIKIYDKYQEDSDIIIDGKYTAECDLVDNYSQDLFDLSSKWGDSRDSCFDSENEEHDEWYQKMQQILPDSIKSENLYKWKEAICEEYNNTDAAQKFVNLLLDINKVGCIYNKKFLENLIDCNDEDIDSLNKIVRSDVIQNKLKKISEEKRIYPDILKQQIMNAINKQNNIVYLNIKLEKENKNNIILLGQNQVTDKKNEIVDKNKIFAPKDEMERNKILNNENTNFQNQKEKEEDSIINFELFKTDNKKSKGKKINKNNIGKIKEETLLDKYNKLILKNIAELQIDNNVYQECNNVPESLFAKNLLSFYYNINYKENSTALKKFIDCLLYRNQCDSCNIFQFNDDFLCNVAGNKNVQAFEKLIDKEFLFNQIGNIRQKYTQEDINVLIAILSNKKVQGRIKEIISNDKNIVNYTFLLTQLKNSPFSSIIPNKNELYEKLVTLICKKKSDTKEREEYGLIIDTMNVYYNESLEKQKQEDMLNKQNKQNTINSQNNKKEVNKYIKNQEEKPINKEQELKEQKLYEEKLQKVINTKTKKIITREEYNKHKQEKVNDNNKNNIIGNGNGYLIAEDFINLFLSKDKKEYNERFIEYLKKCDTRNINKIISVLNKKPIQKVLDKYRNNNDLMRMNKLWSQISNIYNKNDISNSLISEMNNQPKIAIEFLDNIIEKIKNNKSLVDDIKQIKQSFCMIEEGDTQESIIKKAYNTTKNVIEYLCNIELKEDNNKASLDEQNNNKQSLSNIENNELFLEKADYNKLIDDMKAIKEYFFHRLSNRNKELKQKEESYNFKKSLMRDIFMLTEFGHVNINEFYKILNPNKYELFSNKEKTVFDAANKFVKFVSSISVIYYLGRNLYNNEGNPIEEKFDDLHYIKEILKNEQVKTAMIAYKSKNEINEHLIQYFKRLLKEVLDSGNLKKNESNNINNQNKINIDLIQDNNINSEDKINEQININMYESNNNEENNNKIVDSFELIKNKNNIIVDEEINQNRINLVDPKQTINNINSIIEILQEETLQNWRDRITNESIDFNVKNRTIKNTINFIQNKLNEDYINNNKDQLIYLQKALKDEKYVIPYFEEAISKEKINIQNIISNLEKLKANKNQEKINNIIEQLKKIIYISKFSSFRTFKQLFDNITYDSANPKYVEQFKSIISNEYFIEYLKKHNNTESVKYFKSIIDLAGYNEQLFLVLYNNKENINETIYNLSQLDLSNEFAKDAKGIINKTLAFYES